MEPYEMERLRSRCSDIISRIYGYHWSLKITNVSRQDESIIVQGTFTETLVRGPEKSFTIKFDKSLRVLDVSIK
ncbi:MAG: hypothetical protein ACPL1B_09595 [Thermoprotei archaeon]